MITVQPAGIEEAPEIKQVLSETWIDTYGPFLPADVIQKVTALCIVPKRWPLRSRIREFILASPKTNAMPSWGW